MLATYIIRFTAAAQPYFSDYRLLTLTRLVTIYRNQFF